jgi:hypothetical protein
MDEPVDTGFAAVIANPDAVWKPPAEVATPVAPVTATVIPEPDTAKGLTSAGVQAAKALVQLPKDLTVHVLAKMAREIAQNIRETHDVLADYKLNSTQFDFLCEHHEFFKQALHHAIIEWNAAGNTQDRIKLQAAAGFEDKLPLLLTRMGNTSEGLPGVVEAAKLIAKVAGVGERDVGGGAPGEKFTININLGADEKLVVGHKDVTPQAQKAGAAKSLSTDSSGEGVGGTISQNAEVAGGAASFRLVTEGTRTTSSGE